MLSALADLATHCLTVVERQSLTMTGLFLAGLAGSFTHCAGMCGPFVLSQTGALLAQTTIAQATPLRRLRASLLVPYHLGRITTYALIGAAISVPFGLTVTLGGLWWLPPILLVLAALSFVAIALGLLRGTGLPGGLYGGLGTSLARLGRPLISQPTGFRGYVLGLLLGLLPCGLVYAALTGAVSSGEPLAAFLGMVAFGAGTIPALIGVAYGGSWLLPWSGIDLRRAAPYLALGNAMFLMFVAFDLVWRA